MSYLGSLANGNLDINVHDLSQGSEPGPSQPRQGFVYDPVSYRQQLEESRRLQREQQQHQQLYSSIPDGTAGGNIHVSSHFSSDHDLSRRSSIGGTGDDHGNGSGAPRPLPRGGACTECYVRKTKCSGDRPVCRLCTTYHRQCVYKPHEPSKSKDPRKGRRTVKSESVPAAKPSSKPSVEVYTNWLDGGHQVGESAGAVYGSQVVIADEIMKEEVLRLRARVAELENVVSQQRLQIGRLRSDSAATSTSRLVGTPPDAHPATRSQSELDDKGSDPILPESSWQFATLAPVDDLVLTGSDASFGAVPFGFPNAAQAAGFDVGQYEIAPQVDAALAKAQNVTNLPTVSAETPSALKSESSAESIDSIPPSLREHFLSIFFDHSKVVGFHRDRARFDAACNDPDPRRRPPKCTFLAMYLDASRLSPIPQIKNMHGELYNAARDALEETLKVDKVHQHLFYAVKASILLCFYLFSQARYPEAWSMTRRCVALSQACQLHHIVSSVYQAPAIYSHSMREIACYYPPPQSQQDLDERIVTFWVVLYLEIAATVALAFPSAMRDEDILTPFPTVDHTWGLGAPRGPDNVRIADFWSSPTDVVAKTLKNRPYSTLTDHAMLVLRRASDLHIRVARMMPRGFAPSPSPSSVLKALPVESAKVSEAIMAIEAQVGGLDYKPSTVDGALSLSIKEEQAILAGLFVLSGAKLYLYDTNRPLDSNKEALGVVRRMIGLMHLIEDSDLGYLGMFIAMIWKFSSLLLIRERQRLVSIGEHFDAATISIDIEYVLNSMKRIGGLYAMASFEANEAANVRDEVELSTQLRELLAGWDT